LAQIPINGATMNSRVPYTGIFGASKFITAPGSSHALRVYKFAVRRAIGRP
jgi:hypothetical protein